MGATLCTDSGAARITRNDLQHLPTPAPSGIWKPVSHTTLVDTLHDELSKKRMVVTQEEYAVYKKGMCLFGVLALDWQSTSEFAIA